MLFSVLSFSFYSCTDDGTGGGGLADTAPKVTITSPADVTVNPGQTFVVKIEGAKGTNNMKSLTINEAGTKVATERVTLANGSGSGAISLVGANTSSFDFTISIQSHLDIATKKYDFVVADETGLTTTKSVNVTTNGVAPKIEAPTNAGSFNLGINTNFGTNFKVTKGSSDLAFIEVLINDVKATDLTRIYYDDLNVPFTANPFPVPAADKDAFNKSIIIKTPATAGTYKYTIKFVDKSGLSSSHIANVVVGTAISTLEGVLLNQGGPTGTGGLDLDTGQGTGSADTKAEIRDEGIVNSNNDPTWKQQISAANNSTVRYIKKGQNGVAESFSFASINIKEQIVSLWGNGVAFTKKSTDNNRDVSEKVAVGDIFIVKRDDKYYLLETKAVKVTTTDNTDSYTFDVKF